MQNLTQYQAVILCGGQGTRIRGVADNLPKPLIPIGGKPILWHIMKTYSLYGISRFVLCLGYKGEEIISYFENYHSRNHDYTMKVNACQNKNFHIVDSNDSDVDSWEITFALTGENTMTGGRLKRIQKYIDRDSFFCTYGDGVSDINIHELYEYYKQSRKIAVLTGVHLPTTFGIVEAGENGEISSFREKPVMPGFINGGYFVFSAKVFEHIENDATVLEDMPFKRLVRNRDISMFRWDGFWHCMDTFKDYQMLNTMWNSGNAPWKIRR